MAIFVIPVSSNSSKETVRTSTRRVILFGTILTTIPNTTPFVILPSSQIDTAFTPTSPDYTPASLDYSPASDMEFDPSEDLVTDINKGTKFKQNRTKPSTKRKAWKSQKSTKVNPNKVKATKSIKSKEIKFQGLKLLNLQTYNTRAEVTNC
nr:hypothetical protein [Tanacetum cinerariifolium]